jgi:hypothetical protein
MLVLAAGAVIAGIMLGFGKKHLGQEALAFSWVRFGSLAFMGVALALVLIGLVVTVIGGTVKVSLPKAYAILFVATCVLVSVLEGPYLIAVMMGRDDRWVNAQGEFLNVVLLVGSFLASVLPYFSKPWIAKRQNRNNAGTSAQ